MLVGAVGEAGCRGRWGMRMVLVRAVLMCETTLLTWPYSWP